MSWEQIPLSAKAELMKVYVKSGIKSIEQMRNHYNKYGQGGSIHKEEDNPYQEERNKLQSIKEYN